MKYFTLILSFYILGLSFIICNDAQAQDLSSNGIEHVSLSDHDHEHESGDVDLCSPFCSCQCCQITIDTPSMVSFSLLNESIYNLEFAYQDNTFQDYTTSLFNPPRV